MSALVDSSSPARWSGTFNSGSGVTSASFTAPANSVLVVCVSGDSAGNASGTGSVWSLTFSDSGALAWTARVARADDETTRGGTAAIATARTTTSVSRTVTVTASATDGFTGKRMSVKLYVVTGADVDGTPVDTVGAANEGGSATNDLTTTSVTPGATGLLFACDCDWSQSGVFTSSDLTTDTADYAGAISVCSGYKTCTSGVGVTADLDAGGAAACQHKWCQIVVRAAVVASSDTFPAYFHRPPHYEYPPEEIVTYY